MKEEEIYRQWKSHRRQVAAPANFATDVMQRISATATDRISESDAAEFVRSGRLARWSTAGGLILLGFFRLFYILVNLLQPQLIMH